MCDFQRNQYIYLSPQSRVYRIPPQYYYSQMVPATAGLRPSRVPMRSYAQTGLASPNQYFSGISPKY